MWDIVGPLVTLVLGTVIGAVIYGLIVLLKYIAEVLV